ncbi:MAG TPA: TetR/AcrR family transcriptional regulator [Caulobacteraceae bacterium]|nr:TetR/AcrR family transcriptional regulator [Caulobacteraceae bacterium]
MSGRSYRQTARAEAVEATRRRIVDAFADGVRDKWFDEITLEEVAAAAGVTVRTVIRQFGGKQGLVEGFVQYRAPLIQARRAVAPGDVDGGIARIFELYEDLGDATTRILAQESLYPALAPFLAAGRAGHRITTAATFAPFLAGRQPAERERWLDLLTAATDIYVWKLFRRDMGHSETESRAAMRTLVDGVLAQLAASSTGV